MNSNFINQLGEDIKRIGEDQLNQIKKTADQLAFEVKKISNKFQQRFNTIQQYEKIHTQKFQIINELPDGYKKTILTDRLAVLSTIAYWIDDEDSTVKAISRYNSLYPYFMENCEVEARNENMVMIADHTKKHLYFIFKGITGKNYDDYLNAAFIFFNNEPNPRKWEAQKFMDSNLQKYHGKDYLVILTGHSLGGAVCEALTMQNDIVDHCESFNAGTMPIHNDRSKLVALFLGAKKLSNKIISHHMAFDPISWGPVHGAIRDDVKNNQMVPHLMNHFTDRLNKDTLFAVSPDNCVVCFNLLKKDEREFCKQMKLEAFCNNHNPWNCQVCKKQLLQSQKFIHFEDQESTNQNKITHRIHLECLKCMFCNQSINDANFEKIEGFIVHPTCSNQMKQKLDQQEHQYNTIMQSIK